MRLVVFGLLITTTGCTNAIMDLQRTSARAIAPTPYPDSVKISDVRRNLMMSRWVATTPSGVYDCSIATDERVAICARRSTP